MSVRYRNLIATVGLWMVHPLAGLVAGEPVLTNEPAPLVIEASRPAAAINLQVANAAAQRLRDSGQLQDYCIDVAVHAGTAQLSGRIASESQREAALQLVRGTAGVENVVDRLVVVSGGAIRQVQAEGIAPPREPAQLLPRAPTPVNPGNPPGAMIEPMPMMTGQPTSPYDLNPPAMPPYAWPTYAPYNNYSRVAYPQAYPYDAWPFIGPCYPFPKIPLGWRKVQLEWQDGHWWFSKLASKHDWWRLRYW